MPCGHMTTYSIVGKRNQGKYDKREVRILSHEEEMAIWTEDIEKNPIPIYDRTHQQKERKQQRITGGLPVKTLHKKPAYLFL